MPGFIITGGAGFIGSAIARELVSRGHKVKIIDDLSSGYERNLAGIKDKVTFIRGSITDFALLRKEFAGYDYVLHHAAIVSVPRSIADPKATMDINLSGTLNVLIAARDQNIRRVVYASSSSVYGNTKNMPVAEDCAPDPLSPYAVSKISSEQLCSVFSHLYGLETISLRYFNVFGPGQDPSSEYAAVIPKFITAILGEKKPVIYGDGKQTRDFTFIEDIVKANILACEVKKTSGEAVNIATSRAVSLLQLLKEIEVITGISASPVFEQAKQGDIMHSCADITKAGKLLGFVPETSLARGLAETVSHLRSDIKDKQAAR